MPKAVCISTDVADQGPGHAELQAHKDRIRDKLEGILTTVDRLPGILHAEAAQVAVASRALLAREGAIHRTRETLAALPAELSAFDQCVDELQRRAADLQRALHALSSGVAAPRVPAAAREPGAVAAPGGAQGAAAALRISTAGPDDRP